jgi:hypothetical protein
LDTDDGNNVRDDGGIDVNGPDMGLDWDAIDWCLHKEPARRLRQGIFKATQDGDLRNDRLGDDDRTSALLILASHCGPKPCKHL